MEKRYNKGVERARPFEITVDGETIAAYEGETIAAALIAAGKRTFGRTAKKKEPRGVYCGIGLCHQCKMIVDGVPNTRVCETLTRPGCILKTQDGLGEIERSE